MCDQTPVEYKDGDIVWVKLGFCWWPAEVYDLNKLPEHVIQSFRKPPLVAVKFFEEDKFEFVKTIDKIYFYNCTKKNEFIKKGLSLYRSNKRNLMEKFPEDVTSAEKRTQGDPNIIDNPIFGPDEKPDYTLIFGSAKSKKSKKSLTNKSLSSSFEKRSPAISTPNRTATHPRFIGHNDHVVRVLLQTPPDQDDLPIVEDREPAYDCSYCGFKTNRVNVILLHKQSHIPGQFHIPIPTSRILQKSSPKKRKVLRMTKSNTSSLLEDLQLIDKGSFKSTESSDEDVPLPKKAKQENKRKPKKIKPPKTPIKKEDPVRKDIRNDLLAEWDDDSDSENNINISATLDRATQMSILGIDISALKTDGTISKTDDLNCYTMETTISNKQDDSNTVCADDQSLVKQELQRPEKSKSCFDFEDDEEENKIINTSVGRKIPRVIPLTGWLKVTDENNSNGDTRKSGESDDDCNNLQQDPDMEAFKNLLDTTAVPALPQIPLIQPNLLIEPVQTKNEDSFFEDEASDLQSSATKKDDTSISDKSGVSSFELELTLDKEQSEAIDECTKTSEQPTESSKTLSDDSPETQEAYLKSQIDHSLPIEEVKLSKQESSDGFESDILVQKQESHKQDMGDDNTHSSEGFGSCFSLESDKQDIIEFTKEFESCTNQKLDESKNDSEMDSQSSNDLLEEGLKSVVDTQFSCQSSDKDSFQGPDMSEYDSGNENGQCGTVEDTVDIVLSKDSKLSKNDPENFFLDDELTQQPLLQTEEDVEDKLATEENQIKESNTEVLKENIETSPIKDTFFCGDDLTHETPIFDKPEDNLEESSPFFEEVETEAHVITETVVDIGMNTKELSQHDETEDLDNLSSKAFSLEEKTEVDSNQKVVEEPDAIDFRTKLSTFDIPPALLRQDSRELIEDLKPINPKKRFVRTFEQFEQLHNEQKKLTELDNTATSEVSDQKSELISETKTFENKPKQGLHKPKSFRGLILERQREEKEDTKFNRIHNLDLDFSELPSKILDSPFHEELEQEHEQTEAALNLIVESEDKEVLEPDKQSNSTISKEKVHSPKNVLTQPEIQMKDVTDTKIEEVVQNVDEIQHATSAETEHNSMEEYVQTCISFKCEKSSSEEPEDLSALSTLAAVSELTTNFHDIHNSRHGESSKALADFQNTNDNANPTFLTEDDLADGQIEIASIPLPSSKSVSLTNFSVDFPDSSNSEDALQNKNRCKKEAPDLIERSLGKVFADEFNTESDSSNSAHNDIEDVPSVSVSSSPSKKHTFEPPEYTSSSKLLEILTDAKPKHERVENTETVKLREIPVAGILGAVDIENVKKLPDMKNKNKAEAIDSTRAYLGKPEIVEGPRTRRISSKFDPKHTKFVIKTSSLVKPSVREEVIHERGTDEVTVKKISSTKPIDFEDIDAFIIQKPKKPNTLKEDKKVLPAINTTTKKIMHQLPPVARGKAKILQQTIIKPASTIISNATKTKTSAEDNTMFDIDSMPIVLGDQILTPENIENMPVVLSDSATSTVIKTINTTNTVISKNSSEPIKLLNKPALNHQSMLLKTYSHKIMKDNKGLPLLKPAKTHPTIISRPGTSEKFIIVPPANSPTNLKTAIKRPTVLKKPTSVIVPPKVTNTAAAPEPTGNKIMIVTNQQGQQSRVLLTPAQQKAIGYQGTGSKIVKSSSLKSNIIQKASMIKTAVTIATTKSHILASKGEPVLTKAPTERKLLLPGREAPKINRKIQLHPQKVLLQETLLSPSSSRTIVIKNPQGQVVKKIQGLDDALLEQQVQEQVNAIKASGSFAAMKAKQDLVLKSKPLTKRYTKKPDTPMLSKVTTTTKSQVLLNTSFPQKLQRTDNVPPLTPISPKKVEMPMVSKTLELKGTNLDATLSQQKSSNQMVIRDAVGNHTTISEGQILAFPSGETVDGQPQSYMLVTLDENGQLTPLNNEALLSLDPNLGLGGDLSNMVMQVDNNLVETATTVRESSSEADTTKNIESEVPATQQTIQTICNLTGSDTMGDRQFTITGDPVSTQKFLESLSEGSQDLATLLSSGDGNIVIQTEEHPIIINADNESRLLLSSGEDIGGPLFTSPSTKSQDILAAALADTDVFQQDPCISSLPNKLADLSPTGSGLYPGTVANVLETTHSLSSPIMTPLEVPSTNKKKIPDSETNTITTEVPKNVDLPITITDPNITQTVLQQQLQAASSTLDISVSISDLGSASLTCEMNSPSFVYSLPTLDEHEDIEPKSFAGPISMPLLNEDSQTEQSEKVQEDLDLAKPNKHLLFSKGHDRDFLIGLDSTNSNELLSDDLCSSLSEPPPDMFDLADLGMEIKQGATTNMLRPQVLKHSSDFSFIRNGNLETNITNSPPVNIDENSSEIPLQPPIVADICTSYTNNDSTDYSNKRVNNDDTIENDSKKIKYD